MRAFSFAASARSFGILASKKYSFPASDGGKPPEANKIVAVFRCHDFKIANRISGVNHPALADVDADVGYPWPLVGVLEEYEVPGLRLGLADRRADAADFESFL